MLVTRKQRILLVLALMITILQIAVAQEECILKKNSDGIRVYSCKTSTEKLNIVRAEFELFASIDDYLELVRNIENYRNWHFRVIAPEELSRTDDNNIVYHTQIKAPWPVSDRDLVLKLNLRIENNGSLLVTLKSMPGYIPKNENFVRIPYSYSEMRLTPVADNHLKVSYWIKADPGGSLPNWVVNMVSTQGPYETFRKMKDLLESTPDSLSSKNQSNTSEGH